MSFPFSLDSETEAKKMPSSTSCNIVRGVYKLSMTVETGNSQHLQVSSALLTHGDENEGRPGVDDTGGRRQKVGATI